MQYLSSSPGNVITAQRQRVWKQTNSRTGSIFPAHYLLDTVDLILITVETMVCLKYGKGTERALKCSLVLKV